MRGLLHFVLAVPIVVSGEEVVCVGLLEHSPGMWEMGNTGTRARTSPIQPNAYLFVMLESFFLVFEKQL